MRKVILQRFRNAIIKLGQNAGDYLRIFGSSPSPGLPRTKVHFSPRIFNISGFEVANTTADSQGEYRDQSFYS